VGATRGSPFTEIIRYQLQKALNVDARVTPMEFNVLDAAQRAGTLQGLTFYGFLNSADPNSFVAPDDLVGWHDRAYDAALKDANATRDPGLRMRKLAQCESLLLEAMPEIPVTFGRNLYLAKPYVRAFMNLSFRYAWIDHGWKP
jgi:ABC-type oligopeptide transport system substrate-binding subunit